MERYILIRRGGRFERVRRHVFELNRPHVGTSDLSLTAATAMKHLFARRRNDQDFAQYLGEAPQPRKRRLLAECKKRDVSIYVDNPSEQAEGVCAELRAVASEAELEQRLNAKNAVRQSNRANAIAAVALVVSLVALVKSFL